MISYTENTRQNRKKKTIRANKQVQQGFRIQDNYGKKISNMPYTSNEPSERKLLKIPFIIT